MGSQTVGHNWATELNSKDKRGRTASQPRRDQQRHLGMELVRKWRKYTSPRSLSDYYMSLKDLESKAEIIGGREVDQREKQTLFCSDRHQSRTLYEERLVREKQKNFMNTRSQRCLLTSPFLPLTQCLPKTWEEVVREMLLSLPTCIPHSHPGTSPGGALPLQAWRCLCSFLDCWLQESWNPDCLQVSLEQARQASWGPQTTGTAPRKGRRGPSYLTAQDRLTLTCPRGLRLTSHPVRGKQGKGMLWEVRKVNTTELTELAEVWI